MRPLLIISICFMTLIAAAIALVFPARCETDHAGGNASG